MNKSCGRIKLNKHRYLRVLDMKHNNDHIGYRLDLISKHTGIIDSKEYIIMPIDKLLDDIRGYILEYNDTRVSK